MYQDHWQQNILLKVCSQIVNILISPYIYSYNCFSLQSKENMDTIDCITEKKKCAWQKMK